MLNCPTKGNSNGSTCTSTTATNQTTSSNHTERLGKRNGSRGNGDDEPTPKRGRKAKYHKQCGDCSIWAQLGSYTNVKHLHPSTTMRHPGREAQNLTHYVTYGGYNFSINEDSCICDPCYRDYTRNFHNRENNMPRWYKVCRDSAQQTVNKHCLLCCTSPSNCDCCEMAEWGPDAWYGNDDIVTWRKYLTLNGYVAHNIPEHCKHVCKSHYRRVREIISSRLCATCSSKHCNTAWKLVCDASNSLDEVHEQFSVTDESVAFFDWICNRCRLFLNDPITFSNTISSDLTSSDPITAQKATQINTAIETLNTTGIVFATNELATLKSYLESIQTTPSTILKLVYAFSKYMEKIVLNKSHKIQSYCPDSKKHGKVFYNNSIFNPLSIPYVYNQHIENQKLKSEVKTLQTATLRTEKIRLSVKKQTALFPNSGTFDYRSLITEDGSINEEILSNYFDNDLHELIDTITKSEYSKTHSHSSYYKDCRQWRIKMVIALLSFSMNPQVCFMQTLTGLLCYAYGLRDKGFDVLNVLGCTCGIDTIRKHGSHWARNRSCIQELSPTCFWRVSIDNLNFRIKYAKSLGGSEPSAKKQLDLLTGQVSVRVQTTPETQPLSTCSLKKNIFRSLEISAIQFYSSLQENQDMLKIDMQSAVGLYLSQFRNECFIVTVDRINSDPSSNSFMECLQTNLPHWTPTKSDKFVYTTIDEASSANKHDIDQYLLKLKTELKIGQPQYPTEVVIAGDQQTFAIMWSLKKIHPNRFDWMHVLHGDWHLMNLLSQVIRTMAWDGGLKHLTFLCGYKKELTQWQEIHLMLMALHEVLLKKAVTAFKSQLQQSNITVTSYHAANFWEWVIHISSPSNVDEPSRFWAHMLVTLNFYTGYYISIRSGNWCLRNACLKGVTPIFFAYSRDKYEQLCTNVLHNLASLPSHITNKFLQGEWTTSRRGHKFRNLALDEAHESVINLRLKQITARPSHFRTVELSNFMAYRRLGFLSACAYFENSKKCALKSQVRLKTREN